MVNSVVLVYIYVNEEGKDIRMSGTDERGIRVVER